MKYQAAAIKLDDYLRQIADIRGKMRALTAEAEPQAVKDYEFATLAGPVKLSALFAGKDDLIVIHNMGRSCPYCTLWADGFNGIYQHLADRAAFVVTSPDPPEIQKDFAQGRGWRFPMVSLKDKEFAVDMGYYEDGCMPGISVFRREGARVVRVSNVGLGPFDDFCAAWHLFDLLPGGPGDWRPRFSYS